METTGNTSTVTQVRPTYISPVPEPESSLLAELDHIILEQRVCTLFQPIFDLRSNRVFGYEALSRGPKPSPLHMPKQLFDIARKHQRVLALETVCRETAIRQFLRLGIKERLFLNVDPMILMDAAFREGTTIKLLKKLGLPLSRVVIELTEHTHIEDVGNLKQAVAHYRDMGFSIALDDIGTGYSNLQLMDELRPEYIKLDIYFTRKLTDDGVAREFVHAIANLARYTGCAVLAEGIESPEILCEVRKLGLDLAQGYLLGRPSAYPVSKPVDALQIAHFKPTSPCIGAGSCLSSLVKKVASCNPDERLENVYEQFKRDANLLVIPIVEHGRAIGMALRDEILQCFSMRFGRELHGHNPVRDIMWNTPLKVPVNMSIEALSHLITNRPSSHMYTPVIVETNHAYAGLIFVHDLLEHVTQSRIEQAMNANPLTQLPGNLAIEQEVSRRLEMALTFVLCYVDLDHFKAFNDCYGYKRGDAMLRLLADAIKENIPHGDFSGHIGGDDFIIILEQRNGWEKSLHAVMHGFSNKSRTLYDDADTGNGYITSKSRNGEMRKFPLASLSIGATHCYPGRFASHLEAAEIASELKCKAKKTEGNCLEIDQRSHQTTVNGA